MDFVDEKDIAFLKIGEESGEVASFLDGRATGALEVRAHGLGEDVSEGGFAEAGRAAEESVVDGFVALFGCCDGDFETFFDFGLAGEFGKE
jgi:hypothetical protein